MRHNAGHSNVHVVFMQNMSAVSTKLPYFSISKPNQSYSQFDILTVLFTEILDINVSFSKNVFHSYFPLHCEDG